MTIKSILLALICSVTVGAQTRTFKREISLLDSQGKVKAYRNSLVVYSGDKETETITGQHGKLRTAKLGEWFVRHEFGEYRGSQPTITEPDYEPLTVSAEGFSIPEQAAIRRALESWNVGAIRFVYQDNGQVKIKRQSLTVMALSIVQIQGGRVVSADVLVDPHVTNLDALQSAVAHEFGHVLGLADSTDKSSIMFHKSRGKNRDNGHLGPTNLDLQAISGKQ